MKNLQPIGFYSKNCCEDYDYLQLNNVYKVIKNFTDCGNRYEIGETWQYLGYSFLPYDKGLQWIFSFDGKQEFTVSLWLQLSEHKYVANNIEQYLQLSNA
ncbi:DUF3601 domain-containing protein [Orbus wheelerorum]|uniref:hypothetical protein n=1 Tax=Orbus wheelerorum TaxID=3074111 RepID=UPI00370D099A